jgi:hypothetical protein
MFPTGTTTKVLARNQDLASKFWIVQNEAFFGMVFAIIMVPPITKQVLSKTFPVRRFQESGWNNLVRIDILDIHWHCSRMDPIYCFL